MSDAEHDVELLLDRVTPAAVEAPPWPELVGRAQRRRRRRHLALGAVGAAVLLALVGVVATVADRSDEVRVVDDGGPGTTFGLPSLVEELGLDLVTGREHVYPAALAGDGGQVAPYTEPEAVVADFARWTLRWPDPVEIEVLDDERAEVGHPATGRAVSMELGRDADGGWVVERAGDRLVVDPATGAPIVARPSGTAAVLLAAADSSGGSGTGFETTPGDRLPVERWAPLDGTAIVVAASYDAEGRIVEIATARDEDLEPPPLRSPRLVLDSLQLRGVAGVIDESEPTGLVITIGDFDGDSEFRHASTVVVSAVPPWPSRVAGRIEPDPVEVAGYEADVVTEDLSGTRWLQVYLDELTVLVEDGPSAEAIIAAIVSPDDLSDPEAVRFDSIGDSLREVARTPYGTEPVVLLTSEPAGGEQSLLVTADRGPQFGGGGRFERIERGVAFGGGWLGELPATDGRPDSLVLTWEATWGTWVTLIASGYAEEQLLGLADAIELVDRATWDDTYGP